MLGLVITTDGRYYKKYFRKPLYSSAERILGGLFENVFPHYLQEPFCFLCNGNVQGDLPINKVASMWYQGDIAGNVIVMKKGFSSSGPDVVGLTEEECDTVINIVDNASNGRWQLVRDPEYGVL